MSVTIDVAFVQQYQDMVTILAQQRGSKLRGFSQEKSGKGKSIFFDRAGAVAAVKKTIRHSDTPRVDTPHSRRMAVLADYEISDLLDKQDDYRILIDPENVYALSQARAIGRAYDDEFITAMGGTAKTGETGSGSQTLPSGQKIAADFPSGGAAEGLTVGKLRQAAFLLDDKDVFEEDRVFVASPKGKQQLLSTTEIGSRDFNDVQALVQGKIDFFMGFKFIWSTRLSKSSNDRKCYAWQRLAMGMYEAEALFVDIGPRRDKSMAIQVFSSGSFAGVRVEDEAVVEVIIDESV